MIEIRIPNKTVRMRLNHDELFDLFRCIDSSYWYMRKQKQTKKPWFKKTAKLRKKLLKNLNACRVEKHKISVKERPFG